MQASPTSHPHRSLSGSVGLSKARGRALRLLPSVGRQRRVPGSRARRDPRGTASGLGTGRDVDVEVVDCPRHWATTGRSNATVL